MPRVYVSVGSNIEREFHIRVALHSLREQYGQLIVSRVFESEAVGFSGDDFLNLVVGFDTATSVWDVVARLRDIETTHARDRRIPRFSPRTLDLDLLLYGDLIMDEGGVKLPREEITRYAFVLGPLTEIAGEMRCPLCGRCYIDLWREFDQASQPLWPVTIDIY